MKAIVMTDAGSVDVLKLMELPTPIITQANQVLVKIKAAGINPIDTR